ncbi:MULTISPECIES: DUF554 domain-containing protein [Limosilactobacillus]|uniref:DUF554 domain-containing protein n=1 Tax=Limosilactobacillus TaxID=2742598 RepID=UPI0024BA8C3E|nr:MULTISPECIES: DUF554 domain-containing protein [Limosilactobacillus]MDM8220357.1 DUF554 domain-containing protein [Limosilactobacillus mucosae]MDM8315209.1 DUF554 domain-containing protein [Limosilactobacillus mucosae]
MPGLGTIVNVIAIALAGIIGCVAGERISPRFQDMLMKSAAIAVLFLGLGGTMAQMLQFKNGSFSTQGTMMMIGSLAIGSLIGEWLRIEDRFTEFGNWLKQKTGNANDQGFIEAFVTASLTVCIGAMAIVGAIEDGIFGDHSILFAKAILDFVIVLIMAASLGKGCGFAAIPVGILQGTVTLFSELLKPVMTTAVMNNISYVGSILIFCVGVNLFWGNKIRVANLLPALIVGAVWVIF